MKACAFTIITIPLLLLVVSCSEQGSDAGTSSADAQQVGSTTAQDATAAGDAASDAGIGHDHAHTEVDLEPAAIGELTVSLAQGHGPVVAGKEGHLVVKLPYTDNGSTIVRAWIGGKDRTLSMVGRGVYAPSHDDYDVHAMAPDELPANTLWWIELQKPDGTRIVGSTSPILE
jgi:hypothetical protein